MDGIHFVAILAVVQYLYFGFLVGKARSKYHIKPPAVGGNEHFERALRVQLNTLEQLVAFLPALYIAAYYWSNWIVLPLGILYLVGRMFYQTSYTTTPDSRAPGFLLTVVPTMLLLAFGLLGVLFM
ncbi:MAG: MAPEG family protein [Lautropia sp.]|nr:MAPEG family protein [Lautropia sp.]